MQVLSYSTNLFMLATITEINTNIVRPGSATCTGPIFSQRMHVIGVYNTNPLFRKRFIHCAMLIPFILHWSSLFFSKVSNLRKKVLITSGLYFPNYCVTYLPRDISRDLKSVNT